MCLAPGLYILYNVLCLHFIWTTNSKASSSLWLTLLPSYILYFEPWNRERTRPSTKAYSNISWLLQAVAASVSPLQLQPLVLQPFRLLPIQRILKVHGKSQDHPLTQLCFHSINIILLIVTFKRLKNDKWRSQCLLGMACIIIGLEMDLASHENLAAAEDLQFSLVESKEKPKRYRWSDKRMCPPWRLNALETIVPENLPRPSARRRWEAIDYSKIVPAPAPAIKVIIRSSKNCFTM